MKMERTVYDNYKLVIDDNDKPIAVQINGEIAFRLNDIVQVTGDCRGYICPGIHNDGRGKIIDIRRDDTDYFCGVRMEGTGEFGYMKCIRMERERC